MGGPFAEPGREVLRDRRSQIVQSLRRYDRLVARETGTRGRLVVTHGEPHRGNTITTPNGSVLIDWDTTMLAPPERDLWMIAAEDPGVMDAYVAASGTRPRTSALDLYRLRWSLTDIAVYTDEIRRPHEHNEDTLTAWHQLVACCAALAR
jgi:spectinomycin phosphotransferase/16S rRNA (guanine(1405)-N(7))-methyltransferase